MILWPSVKSKKDFTWHQRARQWIIFSEHRNRKRLKLFSSAHSEKCPTSLWTTTSTSTLTSHQKCLSQWWLSSTKDSLARNFISDSTKSSSRAFRTKCGTSVHKKKIRRTLIRSHYPQTVHSAHLICARRTMSLQLHLQTSSEDTPHQ